MGIDDGFVAPLTPAQAAAEGGAVMNRAQHLKNISVYFYGLAVFSKRKGGRIKIKTKTLLRLARDIGKLSEASDEDDVYLTEEPASHAQ